jgi:hypothetical protein
MNVFQRIVLLLSIQSAARREHEQSIGRGACLPFCNVLLLLLLQSVC